MGLAPRIGILGGTFDPIHAGHLIVAESVRDQLGLDQILLVPARQSPLKAHQPGANGQDRLKMIRLAIAGYPGFAVSSIEIDRAGQSYTVETLRTLRESTGADLYFLMGYDQLRDLPAWRDPAEILRLARIVGMSRPEYPEPDLSGLAEVDPAARERIQLVLVPLIEISSTDIRRRRTAGQSIAFRVPKAVQDYIESQGLYSSEKKAGSP